MEVFVRMAVQELSVEFQRQGCPVGAPPSERASTSTDSLNIDVTIRKQT
jgi:hypothetical protein